MQSLTSVDANLPAWRSLFAALPFAFAVSSSPLASAVVFASPACVAMKYVVVTGGVVSGLGKGITSSSVGVLLQACGLHCTSIKIDPYLNTDAGTMSPYEHGEVFVLADGGEADLDLGNYERFLDSTLTKDHNITTGKVYAQVIGRERKGDYLGKTVQVIPHVTDAIQDWIHRVAHVPVDGSARRPDVCMIELGGTVGDIESMVFLEAMRQYRYRVGNDNFAHIHVSLVPVVGAVGEPKSKPTQHGVRELRAAGLQPDLIICRSTQPLDRGVISKISQFCMVPPSHVLSVHDVSNIYKVPLLLHEQRVASLVLNCLRLHRMPPDDSHLSQWRGIAEHSEQQRQSIRVGIVGKYTGLSDSYLSVTKSLEHAAMACHVKVDVVWVDSSELEEGTKASKPERFAAAWESLLSLDGVLIPGGFGMRGVQGMVAAIRHAREKGVPFLGICLGMQVAVIEYAQHVCGLHDASSAEFDEAAEHAVIVYMPEIDKERMGGTMRLGARTTVLTPHTLASQLYNAASSISERHRHRYEVNPEYVQALTDAGLVFSGVDESGVRMECLELSSSAHPFFFACQYHPEFQSRPFRPAPPFFGFVSASAGKWVRKEKQQEQGKGKQAKTTPATAAATTTEAAAPGGGEGQRGSVRAVTGAEVRFTSSGEERERGSHSHSSEEAQAQHGPVEEQTERRPSASERSTHATSNGSSNGHVG